jgi:hypothetical protein
MVGEVREKLEARGWRAKHCLGDGSVNQQHDRMATSLPRGPGERPMNDIFRFIRAISCFGSRASDGLGDYFLRSQGPVGLGGSGMPASRDGGALAAPPKKTRSLGSTKCRESSIVKPHKDLRRRSIREYSASCRRDGRPSGTASTHCSSSCRFWARCTSCSTPMLSTRSWLGSYRFIEGADRRPRREAVNLGQPILRGHGGAHLTPEH